MMKLIGSLIALCLASNLWAVTLDSAQLQKSLTRSHHMVQSTDGSFAIVYGGEDVSRSRLQAERTQLQPMPILG